MLHLSRKIGILLFSLGVVFSPASQLRISGTSIGVGEICMLGSILVGLFAFILRPVVSLGGWTIMQKKYLTFWLISFVLFLFGSVYAFVIGKLEQGSTIHNFSAYLFGFLTITSFLCFYSESSEQAGNKILTYLASFSGVLFLLYIYLFISGNTGFAGCDLYFELRFTGFGLNPNQLAFSCIPIPFLALNIYRKTRQKRWMKVWMIVVLISSLIVGLITFSDALIVSWIFGTAIFYYNAFLRGIQKMPPKRILSSITITLLLLCIGFLFLQQIELYTEDTYGDGVTNNQGSDRILYWRNALTVFTYSPLFGLGPGSYSGVVPFGKEEAHNSFFDWLVSTGIIGIILFLYVLFYKWTHIWRANNREHISIFVALLIFSLFHLTLRHFLFWVLILFL
jgi:O-antigen ligase